MTTLDDHEDVLFRFKDAFEQFGPDLDWIDYNEEHNAIVVEYTEPGEDVQNMFLDHVPKLAGGLTGAIQNAGDPNTHERLIAFIRDRDASTEQPIGMRWTIEFDWAKETSRTEDIETLFHRVGETFTAIDTDGAHDVDVTFSSLDVDF